MATRSGVEPRLEHGETDSSHNGAKKKKKKKKKKTLNNPLQDNEVNDGGLVTRKSLSQGNTKNNEETSSRSEDGAALKCGLEPTIALGEVALGSASIDVDTSNISDIKIEDPGKEAFDGEAANTKKKKGKKADGRLLSDLILAEPRNDSDNEKENSKEKTTTITSNLPTARAAEHETESELKKFTEDTSLSQIQTKERNNFSKVVTLLYGPGLETLRKVFMEIHPRWLNEPEDAKKLKKGKMVLQKHELGRFNTGKIDEWDVSLMTTVLLYSKKCASKLRPGYEDAIRSIKDQKNQLVSHASSAKMPDDTFNSTWHQISKDLTILGARHDQMEDILEDDVLDCANFYRDMLMEEISAKDNQQHLLQNINTNIANLPVEVAKEIRKQLQNETKPCTARVEPQQELRGPDYDEWLIFRDKYVDNFNCYKNNYILLTDALPKQDLENVSVLRSVPWKIVLDFDPSSEDCGMYHDFHSKEGKNSLIDMYTPLEIENRHGSASNLARTIDTRKTQWMFVRGRENDNLPGVRCEPQSLEEWKISSVKHLNGFLRCCSDLESLDKHKPLICIILPILKDNVPFLKVILKRLVENFNEFPYRFVGLKRQNIDDFESRFRIRLSPLSTCMLGLGLKNLLSTAPGKFCIPTGQADLPAKLTNNQLLYLQEYLDVMYVGCQDLPKDEEDDDEERLKKIFDDHKKSFLSGNWISFVSLFDNHDARREIGREIQNHIQRLLEKGPTYLSTIVEILHLPGTGGSTIARRVLWELHKYFPCAIAKLNDYKYVDLDEDYHFIDALADRITEMHEICQTNPLILLDGKHGSMDALCSKLVRALNNRGKRAVLLSCLHRSTNVREDGNKELNPDIHRRFFVKGKLEDCVADRRAFEAKYKDYIDEMTEDNTTFRRSRVFHFPLLAMLKGLKGFKSKLEKIVFDSFDEMDGLQKEIAALVAFIQHYAAQETPASLVYKVFKQYVSKDDGERGITYEEINSLITEHLLNLMVPAKPTRNRKIPDTSRVIPEVYTFQHPLIADMVLTRYYTTQRCDVFKLAKEFLEYPIFQDDQFTLLVHDLFIRRSSRKSKNSILFEDLKSKNVQEAARLFCDLAIKTGNAIVYAHAARFHANKTPPSFQDAIGLITEAFNCNNAQKKKKIICDMKGGILQSHLKFMIENNQVTTLEMLEDLASGAISSYRQAKTNPPTYPGPYIGEVKVWINCIDWITSNICNGDTNKAFKYMNSPEVPIFFSACVNDSFCLLGIVEEIIENEPSLPEPGETQDLVNSLRMSLLRTFRNSGLRGNSNQGLLQTCRSICSTAEFPKCSQVKLKRLQVNYILGQGKHIEKMKTEVREFLLSLLEYLVLENREDTGRYTYTMARHLMDVVLHVTGPKLYSLDKGLQVADIWMQESSCNPRPHFFKMMINFLHILDGKQVMCRDSYNKALSKCKELSEDKCPRWMATHFLNKSGKGMNRLITKNALVSGRESEYSQNNASFWINHGREKLLECRGRIRPKSGKRKQQVYIELVQGNIELYVSKNADIGNVGQDYPPGTMVYFVVGFNLEGPLAYGITFKPLHQ